MGPRFQAEFFIRQSVEELNNYAKVYHERIATAFDDLEAEAKRIQDEAYANHPDMHNPDADPARSAEWAYFKGVDYYIAVDAVRQGVVNLIIAGMFHLFEQQAQFLARRILSERGAKPTSEYGLDQLKGLLRQNFSIEVSKFNSWQMLNQLQLVANVVKHGDGRSAEKLRTTAPDVFKDPSGLPDIVGVGLLRPIVGEGLRLTADHFDAYKCSVDKFWEELTLALLPHFCPP